MSELGMPLSLSELIRGQDDTHDDASALDGRIQVPVEFHISPRAWRPELVHQLEGSWVAGPASSSYPVLFLAIYRFGELSDDRRRLVVRAVLSGAAAVLSAQRHPDQPPATLRNALTLAGFALTSLALAVERAAEASRTATSARPPSARPKVAGKGRNRPATVPASQDSAAWVRHDRAEIMEHIVRLLEAPSVRTAWTNGIPPQDFVVSFSRTCLQLLENLPFAKDKATVMGPVVKVIALCARDLDEALSVTSTLMRLINKYDHLTKTIAELLLALYRDHQCQSFVNQVVRKISKIENDELADDVTGAKNTGQCLAEISDRLPQVILENLTGLAVQLEGDSYALRNGVIHALGAVLLQQTALLKSLSDQEVPDEKDQADQPRPEKIERVIASIFEQLLDHVYDKSPFTRSRVLGCWSNLFAAEAVPIRLRDSIFKHALERLGDKNASVRKNAMSLLGDIICNNPFGPSLSLSHFEDKLKLVSTKSHSAVADSEEKNDGHQVAPQEEFYGAAVAFAYLVEEVVVRLKGLLRSKLSTDVIQAIQLLIICLKFQVEGATKITRLMLELILCRDEAIRQEVVEASRSLICPPASMAISEQDRSLAIAKSLVALTIGASIGELACLEALLAGIVKSDSSFLSTATIQVIWDVFECRVPGVTLAQRRGACQLIAMISSFRPEMTWSRIDRFREVVFDRREDLILFRWSCVALQKTISSQRGDRGMQLEAECDIIKSLTALLTAHREVSNDIWIAAAEQAINTIFATCPGPEAIVANVTNEMLVELCSEGSDCPGSSILPRFLFFIGHVALRQLVYTETRLIALRKTSENGPQRRSLLMGQQAPDEDDALENELGIRGAAAEKDIEGILHSVEVEISSPNSMLGRFVPVAAKLAANPNCPTELQTIATLTLAKFMCIGEDCCRQYLQLLFTILEKSPNASLRSNTIIALGDLCFRFPNLIEPWTSNLYARLNDEVARVRKNTLMALTHLILNGMIKVKGQVAKIALGITDKDERIVQLTKVFFRELHQKNANAVYNILPDTISCLSEENGGVSIDVFRSVMTFLTGFLSKESHLEGVTEKLCQRFKTSDLTPKNRRLAFCISLLPPSEKTIRKLCDNFKCYAAALTDHEVADSFYEVVRRAKRMTRSEPLRILISELEACLVAVSNASTGEVPLEQGEELDEVIREVSQIRIGEGSLPAHIRLAKRKPAPGKENSVKKEPSSSGHISVEKIDNRGRRQNVNRFSSDSDPDSDGFVNSPAPKKMCRPARPLKERRYVFESSDEESD